MARYRYDRNNNKALLSLKIMNITHNNLSLKTILLGNTSIKLHHPFLFPANNFDHILEGSKHYASPELVESMRKGADLTDFDYFKSDVFSLGLIILELSTLVPEDSFYTDSDLKKDVVQLKFNMMKNRYSLKLVNIVQFMLAPSESRPSLEQLLTIGACNLQQTVFTNLMKPTPQSQSSKLSQYIREITGVDDDSNRKGKIADQTPRDSGVQKSQLRLKSSEKKEGIKIIEEKNFSNELKQSIGPKNLTKSLRESLVTTESVRKPSTQPQNSYPAEPPLSNRTLYPIAKSPEVGVTQPGQLSPRYLEKVTTISSILDPNARNSGLHPSTNRLKIELFDNQNQQKIAKRFNEEMRSRSTSPVSQSNPIRGLVPFPSTTMMTPFSRVSGITAIQTSPSIARPLANNNPQMRTENSTPISIRPRNNSPTILPNRLDVHHKTSPSNFSPNYNQSKLSAFSTSQMSPFQQNNNPNLGSDQRAMSPSQYNALPDFAKGLNRVIHPITITPKAASTKLLPTVSGIQSAINTKNINITRSPPRPCAIREQFLNPGLLSPNRADASFPIQSTGYASTARFQSTSNSNQRTLVPLQKPREISPKDVFSSFAELEEKYTNNPRISDLCKENWMEDSKDYREETNQQRLGSYRIINGAKVPVKEGSWFRMQEGVGGQTTSEQQLQLLNPRNHLGEGGLKIRRVMDESVSIKKLEMMENVLLLRTQEINDKIDGMIKRETGQEDLRRVSKELAAAEGRAVQREEGECRPSEGQKRLEVDILGKLYEHTSSPRRTGSSDESSSPFRPKSVTGSREENNSNLLRENSGSITISPQTANEVKMGSEDKLSWIDNCEQALSTSLKSNEDEETLLDQFRKDKKKHSKSPNPGRRKKQSPKSKSPAYCASYLPQEDVNDRQATPRKVFQDNNYWSRLIKEGERMDSRPAQVFHMQGGESGSRRIEFDNPVPFPEVKNKLLKPLVSTQKLEKSQREPRQKDGELEKIGAELLKLRSINKQESLRRSKVVV